MALVSAPPDLAPDRVGDLILRRWLAQGGMAEGRAVAQAIRAGGRFADFKRAFGELGHKPDGRGYAQAVPPIAPEWQGKRRLELLEAAHGER